MTFSDILAVFHGSLIFFQNSQSWPLQLAFPLTKKTKKDTPPLNSGAPFQEMITRKNP